MPKDLIIKALREVTPEEATEVATDKESEQSDWEEANRTFIETYLSKLEEVIGTKKKTDFAVLSNEEIQQKVDSLTDSDADKIAQHKAFFSEAANAVNEAVQYIHAAGNKFFGGEAWWDQSILGLYQTGKHLPITDEEIAAVQKDATEFMGEISPELANIFSSFPSIQKGMNKHFEVAGTEYGDIGGLITYLVNLYTLFNEAPVVLRGESIRELGQLFSGKALRDSIVNVIGEKDYEKSLINSYNADNLKDILSNVGLDAANINALVKGLETSVLPDVKQEEEQLETKLKERDVKVDTLRQKQRNAAQKGVDAAMYTKARYNVVEGQEVNDAMYGKGKVTSTANLENGFVAVAFGPGITVDHYDAAQITEPVLEEIQTVECPMDGAIIVADMCIGALPQEACAFLQFVNNMPRCGFVEACKCQQESKQQCQDRCTNESHEKEAGYTATLNNSLKTASFSDHDYFEIAEYFPIELAGVVKKRNASVYGKVIGRQADSSVNVKWQDGTESIMWESELQGVDEETCLKLRQAGLV